MKLSEHVATSQLPPTLLRSLHIVLDLSLLDVTSLHFFPSMLAAAALYNALPTHLHPALEAYTVNYSAFCLPSPLPSFLLLAGHLLCLLMPNNNN